MTVLPKPPDLDVVGIGSMVVDRLHRLPRILHADEKGILRPFEDGRVARVMVGGVMLNQLGWASVAGLRTGIFGRQADDEHGRFLRAAMDRLGIERDIVLDGSASSVAEIFVDDAGGRAIYMAPGATSETSAEHVRRHHTKLVKRAWWLSTEVSQLPLEAALAARALAEEHAVPVVVDLDVPPSDAIPVLGDEASLRSLLTGLALLKPSKSAARELLPEAGEDALTLARGLRARFAAEAVVVTDGEAGCAIAAEGFEGWIPARRVKAVDTTGAGDAFLGGLLAGRRFGLDWADSARLGNACGAACVERLGAFPDDPDAARARVAELYDGGEFVWPERVRRRTVSVGERPVATAHGAAGAEAIAALSVAAAELQQLRDRSDPASFERAAHLIREAEALGGRVHVTGVGKAGHVARYAAALLASTGTPANFYDANESVHGSSGQIVAGDVVIAVSNSGETDELHSAVEVARDLGARVIAVTGGLASSLARQSEVVLDAGVAREGGPLGLAPRASVAAQAMVIAALGAVLERERGFTRADFHRRHPAGTLGKRTRSPEG